MKKIKTIDNLNFYVDATQGNDGAIYYYAIGKVKEGYSRNPKGDLVLNEEKVFTLSEDQLKALPKLIDIDPKILTDFKKQALNDIS